MISVEYKSVGPGTCGWCKKQKDEIYVVTFSDKSFVGPMCKADIFRAIDMKVGPHEPDRKPNPAPATNAVLAAK